MMNNISILSTNKDIPFPEARINIHQPLIEDIMFISEDNFHPGVQFLNFSIDMLSDEDKNNLEGKSNFDIFMSMMCSNKTIYKINAILVLTLLFPDYTINFNFKKGIVLVHNETKEECYIDNSNFEEFKNIIISMFDLSGEGAKKYNPADGRAAKIAEKFKKREKILAQKKIDGENRINILEKMVTILSVGEQKDRNLLNKYTVYQLKEEFKTYQKKVNFDMFVDARLAGAQDLEEVDNWMDY